MTIHKWFGMGIVALIAVVGLVLVAVPETVQAAGDKGEVALKCEGSVAGAGAVKCLFWIDNVKVNQEHTGGVVRQVDPGKHMVSAQAWYRSGDGRDGGWVKAPTSKKNREVKVAAGETKDVVFDFGTIRQ